METLLSRPDVEKYTGLSCSSIYRLMRLGRFPAPIKVGLRKVGWRESDLTSWVNSRDTSNGDGIYRRELNPT